MLESWCNEVEKRTNGKVMGAYYPGQNLLKGPIIWLGVIDGIAVAGTSALGAIPVATSQAGVYEVLQ